MLPHTTKILLQPTVFGTTSRSQKYSSTTSTSTERRRYCEGRLTLWRQILPQWCNKKPFPQWSCPQEYSLSVSLINILVSSKETWKGPLKGNSMEHYKYWVLMQSPWKGFVSPVSTQMYNSKNNNTIMDNHQIKSMKINKTQITPMFKGSTVLDIDKVMWLVLTTQ